MSHEPVLLHEVIAGLDLRPGLTVLDGTLGDGGHARAIGEIIGATGRLIGLDADAEAVVRAEQNLADLASPKLFRQGNFRDLDIHLSALGIDRLDRALLDLGLSSPQLADPARGFSFQTDGPLLMTFAGADTTGLNAARLVNELPASELADLIARYGEEGYARRIAEAIVLARRTAPILTTFQLVEIIAGAVPKSYRFSRKHFATKTFQALRIAVNDELGALADGLASVWRHLNPGGRLAVISFHSLEARIVKECFRNWVRGGKGKFLTKHAIKPSREEILKNPRARSATLRIIFKII
ncbi:MAG: 16S rRNA (cytosine(1402)-N(4))-methyltransferase RsmH [Candidatus Vogelbacteria bacterium]